MRNISTGREATDHQAAIAVGQRIRRECAWCVEESGVQPKAGYSHGICRRHYHVMMRQMRAYLEQEKQAARLVH